MKQDRYEQMIQAAVTLPQETPFYKKTFIWAMPTLAFASLLMILFAPHQVVTTPTTTQNVLSDEAWNMELEEFNYVNDYILLTSFDF